jgi:hypothetical protein
VISFRYGLVTQQTKPNYKYFSNERTMEEAKGKVIYYDRVGIVSLLFCNLKLIVGIRNIKRNTTGVKWCMA